MTNWMTPLNKIKFQRAFNLRAPQVTLDDGRKFNLDYESRKSIGEMGEVVVRPDEGFVPMGFFDMKRVTNPLWLAEVNKEVTISG